ncbi:4-dihydrotrisporin dehydrogenase [Mycotypha africana]|uniref:4-dihydrotrisporin dehydrogenase n=1 Tax=Mycotypha africana TaxID=64632 RepID=UPI0023005BCD|nr:4-dihydrotrisporin dehydrogenase [Mycotypha africana]KAI8982001.1 4-dihydrotrisporin dehydrogenase [Mycotypha africana]
MAKTYIVTGASRGLGLEFVKQLLKRGDIVFAAARNPDSSKGLQALSGNEKLHLVQLDALSEESIKAAAAEIEKKAPEGVDVLINNAGICGEMGLDFEQTSKNELVKVFETNVAAVNEVSKAFVPILRKRGAGCVKKILNMSSLLGSISSMEDATGYGFGVAYCVSKAGTNMLTRAMSSKLGKENFIVYSSHPGWVQTDMGGGEAPVTTEASISGMLARLDSITAEDNGKFFDFESKTIGW